MTVNKYDYYIGIDPDVNKSGLAVVSRKSGVIDVASLRFADVVDYITHWVADHPLTLIIVEAGWLNKANWHIYGKSAAAAARIGNAAGRNHQTGILLIEMLQHLGMDVDAAKPLRKMWHGKDGKITHEEICKYTNFSQKRSNQEERDAILLAWVWRKK